MKTALVTRLNQSMNRRELRTGVDPFTEVQPGLNYLRSYASYVSYVFMSHARARRRAYGGRHCCPSWEMGALLTQSIDVWQLESGWCASVLVHLAIPIPAPLVGHEQEDVWL